MLQKARARPLLLTLTHTLLMCLMLYFLLTTYQTGFKFGIKSLGFFIEHVQKVI